MPCQCFFHCHRLMDGMISYQITLFLQYWLWFWGVMDNQHVISINIEAPGIGMPIILSSYQIACKVLIPTFMEKICVHLLPFLDTVVADTVSLYTLCCNLLYYNWWLFVLNHLDKDRCNTVSTPHCVVRWIVLSAFSGDIPHFLARTKW